LPWLWFAAVAKHKSRAIGRFGSKRIVVRVFATCRGVVSLTQRDRDHAGVVDPIESDGCTDSVWQALNPVHSGKLQPIAAYCSFWAGFPCRLATFGAIDTGCLSGLTEPMSPRPAD
jgi:hypothetical protein